MVLMCTKCTARRRQSIEFQLLAYRRQWLNDAPVMPDAERAEAHVDIGKRDPEQTHPSPEHVAAIETTDAGVGVITGGRF